MEIFEIQVPENYNSKSFIIYPNMELLKDSKNHHINAIYPFLLCYGFINGEESEFMVYNKTIPEGKKIADKIIKESFGNNFQLKGIKGFSGCNLNLNYLSPS